MSNSAVAASVSSRIGRHLKTARFAFADWQLAVGILRQSLFLMLMKIEN